MRKGLGWFVYYYSFNRQKIDVFNVFNHGGFRRDIEKYLTKYKNKDEFADKLKISLAYYFWSKCEWELIIDIAEDNRIFLSPWSGCREPDKVKIDVTEDKGFNWSDFAKFHIDKQIYNNEAKIDVYDQIMFNWDTFLEYCWNAKIRRPRKNAVKQDEE